MGTGSYFDKALTLTNGELIETMRYALKGVDYDTIVGTGLSGTIFAARVAPGLGKKFAIVRKPNDGSHSSVKIEGHVGDKWVFVDDFISSGETFKRTLEMMQKKPDSQFVGVYQYESTRWEDLNEATLSYGKWVRELTMGPLLGPCTQQEMESKYPYSYAPLRVPAGGWSQNVINKVKPTEDRRRLEVDFPDSYGRPTVYDLDNCCRLTWENPNALPLIEEVENTVRACGLDLRRLVGERMNRLPKPRNMGLREASPTSLEEFQQNIVTADEKAADKLLRPWLAS